jgi:DNA replication protein DnaC
MDLKQIGTKPKQQIDYHNPISISIEMFNTIKDIVGEDYIYTKENREMLNQLFFYFLGSADQCKKRGVSLKKGYAILGKYGCGKTKLFKIMHDFLSLNLKTHCNNFKMVSLEDVIKASSKEDFLDSPYVYNISENEHGVPVRKPIHLLVNEFGSKYNVKLYGTDVNELLEMFWMKRYEIYTDHHKFTHLTANTDLSDIIANNPEKVVDRFKEMFQFKVLKGGSFRK